MCIALDDLFEEFAREHGQYSEASIDGHDERVVFAGSRWVFARRTPIWRGRKYSDFPKELATAQLEAAEVVLAVGSLSSLKSSKRR